MQPAAAPPAAMAAVDMVGALDVAVAATETAVAAGVDAAPAGAVVELGCDHQGYIS